MADALPDVAWTHVLSFLSLSFSSGLVGIVDCRAYASMALVSRPFYTATLHDRQQHRRRVYRAMLSCSGIPLPPPTRATTTTTAFENVCVLALATPPRKEYHCGFDSDNNWHSQLTCVANIVRLDLTCVRDRCARNILQAASHVCRHVRALSLPDNDRKNEFGWQRFVEVPSAALRRWHEANGGLRYLALGELADHETDGPRFLELIAETCPALEVLECPTASKLRRKWTTAWASFWRTCGQLRTSNCAFPICTRADVDQFTAVPKPQLTQLSLNGFNFAWAVDDAAAMASFARTVPSLSSIRLEARPRRRVKPIDWVMCHTLTQCPRLECVTVVATRLAPRRWSISSRQPSAPSTDIPLVTPRGLVALAACGSVTQICIDRVALDATTLVDMVQLTLENSSVRAREMELRVVHCDRDVLVAVLQFVATLSSCQLTHARLTMRVVNVDERVSERNRACNETEVRDLVDAVHRQHQHQHQHQQQQHQHQHQQQQQQSRQQSRTGDAATTTRALACVRVRVDLRTPLADFVADRSGFLVASVLVAINSRVEVDEGVFVDGTRVLP